MKYRNFGGLILAVFMAFGVPSFAQSDVLTCRGMANTPSSVAMWALLRARESFPDVARKLNDLSMEITENKHEAVSVAACGENSDNIDFDIIRKKVLVRFFSEN